MCAGTALAPIIPSLSPGKIWGSADEITIESLLRQMLQRDALASFPDPPCTCRQASSYDRRSVAPDKPGWFANDDWSQFIGSEQRNGRTEWIMMDAEGPGAIVRFWMGTPFPERGPKGTLRVYLDGSDRPAIEEEADSLLSGRSFVPEPLSEELCYGRNLYLPIPYARRCKVTYDRPNYWKSKNPEDKAWYNINYLTYPADVGVETFTPEVFAAARLLVDETGKELLREDRAPKQGVRASAAIFRSLKQGQSLGQKFVGPGAVRQFSVRIGAKNLAQSLRSAIVVMEFDHEQTVWSPAGDFFGSGVGLNPFRDWWRRVDKDGTMTCWWVMPFRRSCSIRIENIGIEPIDVSLRPVLTGAWEWDDRSMHFHANWRQQYPIQTQAQQGMDWNYIEIAGKGVYVGDTLTIHNGSDKWWGEGDEKIFVDGEAFPSNFGTGTEDYYGYSWGDHGGFFEAPFIAEPRAEGNKSPGYTVNTRTRSLDAIPFMKSLKFDMEIWHWATTTMSYAAATYWYGQPGAKCNRPPSPEEARRLILA